MPMIVYIKYFLLIITVETGMQRSILLILKLFFAFRLAKKYQDIPTGQSHQLYN